MSTVIRIENLSKRYIIKSQFGYVNFKEVLSHQLSRLVNRSGQKAKDTELWALKDINLEIHSGELIGLVGLNGSGKSTFLKLLAEVLKPTTGKISLWGRIGSLLEVGTGFHPELTGRENVYLSGTILGMSLTEIAKNFDEIVAFSEIGNFLDVPVKRYSSGMYMRLGFSVAAHLDPDILLIDEALAVGDMNFRRKCVNKMRSFAQSGATVIFVTHNMSMVSESCNRCLLLEKGLLIEDGPANTVIQKYLKATSTKTSVSFIIDPVANDQGIHFRHAKINDEEPVTYSQPFTLEISLEILHPCRDISLGFGFCNLDGMRLLSCEFDTTREKISCPSAGPYAFKAGLPHLDLSPGVYLLDLWIRNHKNEILNNRPACAQIEILPQTQSDSAVARDTGGVRQLCQWQMIS